MKCKHCNCYIIPFGKNWKHADRIKSHDRFTLDDDEDMCECRNPQPSIGKGEQKWT